MPKNTVSFFKSFRIQLLVGLLSIIAISLFFEFYIFVNTNSLKVSLDNPQIANSNINDIKTQLSDISQVSFYFLATTLIFVSGILIYLLFTLSTSLTVILHGISLISKDLRHRINLDSDNEFGQIARFLNRIFDHIERLVNERTQALATEKEKLSTVLSGIEDSVIAVNHHYQIITFNKAAEVVTGYLADDVIGKPLPTVINILQHQQPVPITKYCPLTSDQTELFRSESVTLVAYQGKSVPIRIAVRKLEQPGQTQVGAILTFHDLSRDQELETMKLDFVSIAAHELRTPLTSIRGYSQLLTKDTNATNLNPDQLELIRRIGVNSEQLGSLIDNLLSVSKIERNAFNVNFQQHNLVQVLQETIDGFRTVAKIKNQTLQFVSDIPAITLFIDNIRISQVIGNLVSNAISYTPQNGNITITVETREPWIWVSVKDTGQGIPNESIPKLFTKFYRVSGALEQGSKGTGLGLYICKAIIELHGGQIWVESELGAGSKFTFSLPIQPAMNRIDPHILQETGRSGIVINKRRHPNS